MATVKQIYADLFAGKRLTLRTGTRREHLNLRSHLQKQHQIPAALDMTDKSLCADWNAETGESTFYLGESRRSKPTSWEIVKVEDGQ